MLRLRRSRLLLADFLQDREAPGPYRGRDQMSDEQVQGGQFERLVIGGSQGSVWQFSEGS